MKKQTWLIASTLLKILYLTPAIVLIALRGYPFNYPIRYSTFYIVGKSAVTSILLLGLLATLIYDVLSSVKKTSSGKTQGFIHSFLYVVIPVICLGVASFLFLLFYVDSNGLASAFWIPYFGGPCIGALFLFLAFLIDRSQKRNRNAELDNNKRDGNKQDGGESNGIERPDRKRSSSERPNAKQGYPAYALYVVIPLMWLVASFAFLFVQ